MHRLATMRGIELVIAVSSLGVAATARTQIPFDVLSPESSPAGINSDVFTTLTHPSFSKHSLRVKRQDGWCEDDTSRRVFTGYLDVAHDKHIFFYAFDARGDAAATAPLIGWTNGGPGASASMGMLMENIGPCSVDGLGDGTIPNPYSWSEAANLIFFDQPVGVGYSYADHGVYDSTTEEAAVDMHAFLTLLTEIAIPDWKGREFYFAGESYGGRYLPVFASEVLHQNELLSKAKDPQHSPINLAGVMIGNGLTDAFTMMTSYYDQACTAASGLGRPVIGVKACIEMQPKINRCQSWTKEVCIDKMVQPDCSIAVNYCVEAFETPFIEAQLNPYDISQTCTTLAEDLCYPQIGALTRYLDNEDVKKRLGVDQHVGNFTSVSWQVNAAFQQSFDEYGQTWYHVGALLERGIRVLVYVGEYDWICNFIGNRRWAERLSWSGRDAFHKAEYRPWTSGGKEAGDVKSAGPFTYATIRAAGHMVPLDKPTETLDMVKRWLAGEEL